MGWLDQVTTGFTIRTGDNKVYSPNWLNANFGIEYNVADFEFPGVAGTLAKRSEVKGTKYPIEIYFQGDDHLTLANDFRLSCNDPRNWIISHPFYGEITVCPVSLDFGNQAYNVTKITGTVIETISDDVTRITVDPSNKIIHDVEVFNVATANAFAINIPKPDTKNINVMLANTKTVYTQGSKKVKTTLDAEKYFNAFNEANAFIVRATQEPLAAINKIQAVINAPSLFAESVFNRINILKSQFDLLRNSILNIVRKSDKHIYENNATVLVGAMAQASIVTPDYYNRSAVVVVMDIIKASYDQLIQDLDSLQTANGGTEDSYIPDAESLTQLSGIINFTLANLINIALSSKQERVIYLEKDSNVILVASRLYGMYPLDDSTIDKVISENNIGLNEYLILKKDRRIVWYV